MKLKAGLVVEMQGKTEFGKSFVESNGHEYKVVKIVHWGEEQLVLENQSMEAEVKLIMVNWLPESKNFRIELLQN